MNNLKHLMLFFLLMLTMSTDLQCQWLDKQNLQATVLIEKIDSNHNFIPHGTGFLIYNYDKKSSELIVVTCAHLLKGKSEICVRVNPDTSIVGKLSFGKYQGALINNALITNNSIRFIVDLKKIPTFFHPQKDIAAFYFSVPAIYQQKDSITRLLKLVDILSIPKSGIRFKKDLSLGDEAYFIGFPLGYGAAQFVEPIIRSGSIAWLPVNEP